ncbi:MAG: NAD(P)H-hydrate dehydratase [Saprospiraceae bacterium]|nr:NAD(P)H-hydrate dehydratase [Saprospiraceae bacterium]
MKILSAEQIRQLDAYTIEHEPIASIDLMERASRSFAQWFVRACPPQEERPVLVFCGTGNNGGDGLAIARLLAERFYQVEVFHCKISERGSADFQANLSRLVKKRTVPIHTLTAGQSLPAIPPRSILIDALFGSGLNRPVEGYWAELIEHLNRAQASRVAVDIPSGLFADRASSGTVFRADHTLTFELPKLAFLMAENAAAVGRLHVRSIGLHTGFIRQAETEHFLLEEANLRPLLKERGKFDHKGTFGHALLLCGSYGKVGAAILSGKACLRSGAGLLTIHAPRCAYEILQIGFPEAMVSVDPHQYVFTQAGNLQPYRAIGLGPGWGTNRLTAEGLHDLLERVDLPLVIDADALNLLAENPDWLKKLPAQSILCPHPGEFSRLFGPSANQFERLQLQKDKARELNCVLILKGAYSSIALPDGKVYFNSTGNPGMGTAGSGDVLTGLLTGLLAQGYSSCDAALLGVYLHGLSGDLACRDLDQEALLAGDLIRYFGKAFHALRKKEST